ncbi:MAG: hypothetical protein CVU09_04265 [Bacteroidetes bacterium HGW-Bacteroidetes-4]|jgi:hypothetical protein|nr:MAG: hypothetical protein CVU09_04265 [Bacteroidetes bacterium HGW-Bacteroidetes-4]
MNIENYINQQKKSFDDQEPNTEYLWLGISRRMERKPLLRLHTLKSIAAVLVLFVAVGVFVRHELMMQKQITSLSQINQELAEREQQYKNQVEEKWAQFTSLPDYESPMEVLLIEELNQLDILYQNGLKDIYETGYNERAVFLLLDTYEKRLRIIEKLIYEKQKQKNYENKNQKYDL